jgi:hypothetical protein
MGYRSEVGYAIAFDRDLKYADDVPDKDKLLTGVDVFNTFLAEAKSKDDTKLCFEHDELEVQESSLLLKFYASDWKWYDDYDDVQCHEKLLELAEEYINSQQEDSKLKHLSISYGFVRIGEETEDIDTRYGGDDGYSLLYPTRGIEFEV